MTTAPGQLELVRQLWVESGRYNRSTSGQEQFSTTGEMGER